MAADGLKQLQALITSSANVPQQPSLKSLYATGTPKETFTPQMAVSDPMKLYMSALAVQQRQNAIDLQQQRIASSQQRAAGKQPLDFDLIVAQAASEQGWDKLTPDQLHVAKQNLIDDLAMAYSGGRLDKDIEPIKENVRQRIDPSFARWQQTLPGQTGLQQSSSGNWLGDMARALTEGNVLSVAETGVGLANIPTGGAAGKALEGTLADTGALRQAYEASFAPEQRAAREKVQQAEGFWNTLGALISEPRALSTYAAENLAGMGAGAAVRMGAKGLGKLGAAQAAKAVGGTPLRASLVGQSLYAGGMTSEQLRREREGGYLSPEDYAAIASTMATEPLFGLLGAKAANRFGVVNPEVYLAMNKAEREAMRAAGRSPDMLRAAGRGALIEGLEEIGQESSQQIAMNLAQGKPWDEGVGNAAAIGFALGSTMGGVVNTVESGLSARRVRKGGAPQEEQLRSDQQVIDTLTPEMQAQLTPQDTATVNDILNTVIQAEQQTSAAQAPAPEPGTPASTLAEAINAIENGGAVTYTYSSGRTQTVKNSDRLRMSPQGNIQLQGGKQWFNAKPESFTITPPAVETQPEVVPPAPPWDQPSSSTETSDWARDTLTTEAENGMQTGQAPTQEIAPAVVPQGTEAIPGATQQATPDITPTPTEAVAPSSVTEQTQAAINELLQPRLPVALAGAKPRFAFGQNQFTLRFASDVDKAAYIAAQRTKSKRDAAYVDFVRQATGMTEPQVRAYGDTVKSTIRDLAQGRSGGIEIVVPDLRTQPSVAAAPEVRQSRPTVSEATTESQVLHRNLHGDERLAELKADPVAGEAIRKLSSIYGGDVIDSLINGGRLNFYSGPANVSGEFNPSNGTAYLNTNSPAIRANINDNVFVHEMWHSLFDDMRRRDRTTFDQLTNRLSDLINDPNPSWWVQDIMENIRQSYPELIQATITNPNSLTAKQALADEFAAQAISEYLNSQTDPLNPRSMADKVAQWVKDFFTFIEEAFNRVFDRPSTARITPPQLTAMARAFIHDVSGAPRSIFPVAEGTFPKMFARERRTKPRGTVAPDITRPTVTAVDKAIHANTNAENIKVIQDNMVSPTGDTTLTGTSIIEAANGNPSAFKRWTDRIGTILVDKKIPVVNWIDKLPITQQMKNDLVNATYLGRNQRSDLIADLQRNWGGQDAMVELNNIAEKHNMIPQRALEVMGTWITTNWVPEVNIRIASREAKRIKAENAEARTMMQTLLEQRKQYNNTQARYHELTKLASEQQEIIDKNIKSLQDFKEAVNNPNMDIKSHGVELAGGMSTAQAATLKAQAESILPVKEIRKVAESIWKMNRERLVRDVEGGRVSPDMLISFIPDAQQNQVKTKAEALQVASRELNNLVDPQAGRLEAAYKKLQAAREALRNVIGSQYVPLTSLKKEYVQGSGSNQTVTGDVRPLHVLEGSKTRVAENGIVASFRNVANAGYFKQWEGFRKSILAAYQNMNDAQRKEAGMIALHEATPADRASNTALVVADSKGKEYAIKFRDASLLEAINTTASLGDLNPYLKPFAFLSRNYGQLLTRRQPIFAPINGFRDFFERLGNIQARTYYDASGNVIRSRKIIRDMFSNLPEVTSVASRLASRIVDKLPVVKEGSPNQRVQTYMEELMNQGGFMGYIDQLSANKQQLYKQVEALSKDAKIRPRFRKTFVDGVSNLLDKWNRQTEIVPILTSYISMRENGMRPADAAYQTLDLVNFGKSGIATPILSAFYPFVRSAFVGGQNVAKALSTKKGRIALLGRYAVLTMMWMAIAGMSDDDEDGNHVLSLADVTTNGYIPIPVGDSYIRIPISFSMDRIANVAARNTVQVMHGYKDPAPAVASIFSGGVLPAMTPFEAAPIGMDENALLSLFSSFASPTAWPLLQIAFNQNDYGRALAKAPQKGQYRSEVKVTSQPPIWQEIAEEIRKTTGFDWPSTYYEHLFKSYLPGLPQDVTAALVTNPHKQAVGQVTQIPLMSRLWYRHNPAVANSRLRRMLDDYDEIIIKAKHGETLTPTEQRIKSVGSTYMSRISKINARGATINRIKDENLRYEQIRKQNEDRLSATRDALRELK